MRKAVIFLQNAWSPYYAGKTWPRRSWLWALKTSRSGQRLAILEKACSHAVEIWYDNTTPQVGNLPNSQLGIDQDHVNKVIYEQNPDVVVACGKQAEEALQSYLQPLLIIPHPAYRVVTNKLLHRAGTLLITGWNGKVKLTQEKGRIACKRIVDLSSKNPSKRF